jgi:hypothetical protein
MKNNELMLDVGQANEIKLAFRREGNWDNEKIKILTERMGFLLQVLDVLEGRSHIVPFQPPVLRVDFNLTLGEMIVAGRYGPKGDNWNKDITQERFPIVGAGIEEFEFKLFGEEGFEDGFSSEKVIKIIKEDDKDNPWSPAQTEHTLAFGAQFPDAQRKNPIIGLGSVARVGGHRRVLDLSRDGSERDLGLRWFDGDWDARGRFLAVRKVFRPSVS